MQGASLVAQLIKNLPVMQETLDDSRVGKIPQRRYRQPTPVFLGFPGGSDGKESTQNVGYLGLIPGLGRFLEEGNGNPLQYSCLREFHGQRSLAGYSPLIPNSWTQLSDLHFIMKGSKFSQQKKKKNHCTLSKIRKAARQGTNWSENGKIP